MNNYQVSVSAVINAPAEQVYGIIADYHNGHPLILPKQYFPSLDVEQGGVGAGTVIRFQMRALGQTRTSQAVVTEPEPGRVLVETVQNAPVVTTFTVEPLEPGRSRVTFTTDIVSRGGLAGWLERLFTTNYLRRVYTAEQALLAALAEQRAGAPGTGAPLPT